MRRILGLLALLAFAQSASAVENLSGVIAYWDIATSKLYGLAQDKNQSNPITIWYTVRMYWDDPAMTGTNYEDIVANGDSDPRNACASNCKGFGYPIPTGLVGTVNPKDGQPHLIYPKIISKTNPGAGDCSGGQCMQGSPWPFTWTSGVIGPMWSPALETSAARLLPAQLAVIVRTGDTYGVGTTGTPVCTHVMPDDISLFPDGVAGYYIQQHGVPCANSRAVTLTLATTTGSLGGSITKANSDAQLLPVTNALPSTIQAIALAWAIPGQVTNGGVDNRTICGVVGYGAWPTGVLNGTGLGIGPDNGYFNTASKAPFTDYGIRPTMVLAAATCSGCTSSINYNPTAAWTASATTMKGVIDAAVAGINSDPVAANVYFSLTSDTARSTPGYSTSTLSLGTNVLGSGITSSITGTIASPDTSGKVSGSNILAVAMAKANWNYNTAPAPTFLPGAGIGVGVTSTSGTLIQEVGGNNQSPIASWLTQGAVAAYGTGVEPGVVIVEKTVDFTTFVANYRQGQTAIEAMWKSVKQPWQGQFIGDPLAAPYSLAASAAVGATVRGSTLRGVRTQ